MTLKRVLDGDTIEVEIDLGFEVTITQTLRLVGIDTPEIHATNAGVRELAMKAKDHVFKALSDGHPLVVRTIKAGRGGLDKYGRYLASVFYAGADGLLVNLNDELVALGLAKKYDGGAK